MRAAKHFLLFQNWASGLSVSVGYSLGKIQYKQYFAFTACFRLLAKVIPLYVGTEIVMVGTYFG